MVGTIGPVVHGHHTRSKRLIVRATYALSHVAGAAVVGASATWLGIGLATVYSPTSAQLALGLGLVTALMSLRELNVVPLPMPQRCWQVPRYWAKRPAPVMAAVYGFVLGTGLLTFINSSALYATLAACILLGDVVWATVAMGLFGLARAVAVLIATAGYVQAPDRSAYLMRLTNAIPRVRRLNAATLAAIAGFLTYAGIAY